MNEQTFELYRSSFYAGGINDEFPVLADVIVKEPASLVKYRARFWLATCNFNRQKGDHYDG